VYRSWHGAAASRLATALGGLLQRPNGEAKRGLIGKELQHRDGIDLAAKGGGAD
jgi:hypothetical protein